MKKTILTLSTAAALLFATACNNDTSNREVETFNEMEQEGMMAEDGMDPAGVESSADYADLEIPQFQQAPAEVKNQVQKLTDFYLSIKNALVTADPTQAQAAATQLMVPLEQFNVASLPADQQEFYNQQAAALKDAATSILTNSSIDEQRNYLGELSLPVYALNKAFDANEQDLYRQFCPMANNNQGGYWLSAEQEIRNPYFGEKMLKCGSVRETL